MMVLFGTILSLDTTTKNEQFNGTGPYNFRNTVTRLKVNETIVNNEKPSQSLNNKI